MIEAVLDDGGAIPAARSPNEWLNDGADRGWIWAIVDVALESLSDKAERINITLWPASCGDSIGAPRRRAKPGRG